MLLSDDVPADAPMLGPDSLTWRYFGDVRMLVFGFQRLGGTENAIEQLAQGVEDHSIAFGDFIGRAKRTARNVASAVYAEDPYAWGRRVRDFHKPIKGTVSDGSRYHALNPELFYWGHATFVDLVIYVTDTFIRRLTYAEKEQIFEEGKVWYGLYGVSARDQPATYAEFLEYWDAMVARFEPTRVVRYGTGYIRKGLPRPRLVPAPIWKVVSAPINAWTRVVVAGTLPPDLRDACGLDWSDRHERRFQRIARVARASNRIVSRLPLRATYLPLAVEAWQREGVDPRRLHTTAGGAR